MPFATINGVDLHYRQSGSGFPVVLCHEYAADARSLDLQQRFLSRRYRCISFNYRGYPPSSVPDDRASYGSEDLVSDLSGLLDHLDIAEAYIVGVATGGGVALGLAIERPEAVRALVVVGAGAGSSDRENWLKGAQALVEAIEHHGTAALVANMEAAPQRQALRLKDPIAWKMFIEQVRELSPVGCAHMMSNALITRTPLLEMGDQLRRLSMPVLVVVGDQDKPAFEASLFVSQTVADGALCVMPRCGHMVPVEEPAEFNAIVSDFLGSLDASRHGVHRSQPAALVLAAGATARADGASRS